VREHLRLDQRISESTGLLRNSSKSSKKGKKAISTIVRYLHMYK
jgi:hypothetical protein